MAKKKFYAVARGRKRGIYNKWFGTGGAHEQVEGYAGARFKGFALLREAEAFLEENAAQTGHSQPQKTKPQKTARPFFPVEDKNVITIYTDGCALGNPGPGGYGIVIGRDGATETFSRGFRLTTNNRMELLACIVALEEIDGKTPAVIHSDSRYVINAITKGWAKKWRNNNWMRTKKEPALNADLWARMLPLCEKRNVSFHWVKGHAGIDGNEQCDQLANAAARSADLEIDKGYEENKV